MYLHLHREQSLSDVRVVLDLNHTAAPETNIISLLVENAPCSIVLACISQRE